MTLKLILGFSFIFQLTFCFAGTAKKIVFIGDSLTEGYQLSKEYSFPSLIQKKLDKDNLNYEVINGGVSGATSASGMSRLKWFLKSEPEIIVFALGANDGLRGLKVAKTRSNLEKVIQRAKELDIKLILAGMQIPPNYGVAYTESFRKMFPTLAKKYNVPLIPFLLEGVAGKKSLNLADGIHPNKKGYEIIANTVYKKLKELL